MLTRSPARPEHPAGLCWSGLIRNAARERTITVARSHRVSLAHPLGVEGISCGVGLEGISCGIVPGMPGGASTPGGPRTGPVGGMFSGSLMPGMPGGMGSGC